MCLKDIAEIRILTYVDVYYLQLQNKHKFKI